MPIRPVHLHAGGQESAREVPTVLTQDAGDVIPTGAHTGQRVEELRASAGAVVPGPGPTPATTAENLLRWLESHGVRLVHIEGIDLQPCGGSHLRATGEIGRVRVAKMEKKGRQNRRVEIAIEDLP